MPSPLLVDDYLGSGGGGGRDVDVWNTAVAVFFVAFTLWGYRLLVRATKLSDVSFALQSGNVRAACARTATRHAAETARGDALGPGAPAVVTGLAPQVVNTRGHRLRVPALRTLTLRHTRHLLRGAHDVRPEPVRNLRAPFAVDRASFRAVPEPATESSADGAGAAESGAEGRSFSLEGTVLSTCSALVAVAPLPARCSARYTFAGTAAHHVAIARHARRMFRLATRAAADVEHRRAHSSSEYSESGAGEAGEEAEEVVPRLTRASAHWLAESGSSARISDAGDTARSVEGTAGVDLAPCAGADGMLAAALPRGASRLCATLHAPPPRRRRRDEVGYAVGVLVCGSRSARPGAEAGSADGEDTCVAAFAVATLGPGSALHVSRFLLAPDLRASGPPGPALRLLRAEVRCGAVSQTPPALSEQLCGAAPPAYTLTPYPLPPTFYPLYQPAFGLGAGEHRGECVVCLCEPRAVVLLPCRHLAVCGDCLPHLDKCPCCRAAFDGYLMPRDPPAGAAHDRRSLQHE